MTEQKQENTQQFLIQKIYCKDISFEAPNSPQIFTENIQPEMKVDLNTSVNVLSETNVFEVILSITVTAQAEDKTAFLVEVHQAGIFQITGYEKPHLDAMLGSYCPNLLFPFAREAITDLVNKGGFPQLILQPVNFDAMYQQHLESQQAQTKQPDAKTKH